MTAIKISSLLAWSFVFYDLNLARLSLRISPKFQSSKNVPLHSDLSHLSFNFYCSCQPYYRHANIAYQGDFFMARVSPSIFVRVMFNFDE